MTDPFGRSAVEQREYERHHYPGTDVLVNTLDIRDPVILEATERSLVAKRYQQGLPEAALTIDSPGLQAIHGHLFQDIYAWAGEFRRYTTGRGAAPFAPPDQIRPWLDQQFEDLKTERYLNNMDAAHFADRPRTMSMSSTRPIPSSKATAVCGVSGSGTSPSRLAITCACAPKTGNAGMKPRGSGLRRPIPGLWPS